MTGQPRHARRHARIALWVTLIAMGALPLIALPGCANKQTPKRQALMSAAREGDLPTAWLLLEQGLDPNFRNQDGETPLHLAAWRGDEVMIRELLQAGAAIESQDKADGRTPLGWAVFQGRRAAVEALIDAGADVNHRERTGATPLMLAAVRAPGLVSLLLDRGATAGADEAMAVLRRRQEEPDALQPLRDPAGDPPSRSD